MHRRIDPPQTHVTVRLVVGVLAALQSLAAGGGDPEGRVRYVGSVSIAPDVFEAVAAIHVDEEPERAVLFDQDAFPSFNRSCHSERWKSKYLKIIRPLDGASFPKNAAAPRFRWEDLSDNAWMLSIAAPGWTKSLRVVTDRREWTPSKETWEAIKAGGPEGWVDLTVRGCFAVGRKPREGKVYMDRVRFRISKYAVDPVVVYRLVTPLFHGLKTPNIYWRDLVSAETRMFLPSKTSYCTNCHVFPNEPAPGEKDVTMAVAVRKSFESLRLLGLYDFGSQKGETVTTNTFFMSWGPKGRKLAVTAGERVAVRVPITLETQQFHVCVADIVIVDRDTLDVLPLAGASEPDYMETLPAWSPDGKTIVFARAKEFGEIPDKVKYELFKVPYNNGNGGQAVPVAGATGNGKSNYAPRFSPDGKWLVFNMADSGSLVEPTADLWIVSTEEGALPMKLECNTENAMDSHHSWSSNSRWLLFAGKPEDGIFARVYLTEIDDEGHASPPVEMPGQTEKMVCYNVPEFLRYRPKIDPEDILVEVSTPKK